MTAHRARRAALVAVVPLVAALTGCAADAGARGPGQDVGASERAASPSAARPTTPADILERAREAMAAEKGWTFAVKGKETLAFPGQTSAASYTATVRQTSEPKAFHSTGTIVSKGTSRSEEVFVAGGTGRVREGGPGAAWKTGSVSDPEIANKVEDPVDALKAFDMYAEGKGSKGADGAGGGEGVEVIRAEGEIRLEVRVPSGRLSDRRTVPALAKAARELRPTLSQLRDVGVTAGEHEITLTRLDEVLVLDADTYRISSHRFAFGFLIPYQGKHLTFSQEVREENRGVFGGTLTPPE
ncbi:hypothetical protein [Streptomyces acidicola]|uniref:hypothetical protein n=1 Tax=Streptomyces acidicola TaxID=2596892 RepID=UPI0038117463